MLCSALQPDRAVVVLVDAYCYDSYWLCRSLQHAMRVWCGKLWMERRKEGRCDKRSRMETTSVNPSAKSALDLILLQNTSSIALD